VAVGVLFMLRPAAVLPRADASSGTSVFLMRTIGIRDVVLGAGALLARVRGSSDDVRRWSAVGAASDALDTVAGVGAQRLVGRRGALTSVLVSAPWAIAGAVGVARQRPAQ
jgi:hypothetical protein